MRFLGTAGTAFASLLVAQLLFPSDAHAYLDPGSGSFIFQMIVAAILGAGVTLRMQWKKVRGLFSPTGRREPGTKGDE